MGFLDFIFGKSIKIDDPFFGKMLFLDDKKEPLKSYFECRRHFEPTNEIIEIGIDGALEGPTETQKKFFKEIESKYGQITDSIKPLMESEFRNWNEDFEIIDFNKEFKADYLRIPRCSEKPISWEIGFISEHDPNHIFTATMTDLISSGIQIDG